MYHSSSFSTIRKEYASNKSYFKVFDNTLKFILKLMNSYDLEKIDILIKMRSFFPNEVY